MMRRHVVLTQPLAQLMGNAFGQPPRVYEDQRRPVRVHQLHDALVNLVPHLVRSDWTKFRRWNLYSNIQRALVANVDDYRIGASSFGSRIAGEKARDFFNR